MTYFHTGTRTIIGAKSFHCPVRDGKEWSQLAMVIRHKGLPRCPLGQHSEFTEFQISFCARFYFFECIKLGITHSLDSLGESKL